MFQLDKIEHFLQLNIEILDDSGAVVTQGRQLKEIKQRVPPVVPR